MTGFWIVLVALGYLGLLIVLGRVIDRVRGIDTSDKWAGWYRGKTHDVTQTMGVKGSEYDSMDDHGNHEADGGL